MLSRYFLLTVCVVCMIAAGRAALAEKNQDIPYASVRRFAEVFAQIKAHYVETVDDKTLLENAIRGMLDGLDPHSTYLDKEEFTNLQESTSGEFGGLGIKVSKEGGFIKVISPIDETPAKRAGIEPGDLIIRLDETSVKDISLNEAVELMRGKPGTSIELTIIRENVDAPFKVIIERDVIRVKSVRGELLDPNYAYIRISTFQSRTGKDLHKTIEKLKKENKEPLRGLILDLRNNPGGVLSAAQEVADTFLEQGLIVYTKGRNDDAELKYNATPGDALNGAPLIVMVNTGSASASEIVAGAIQDHVRGIVMGSTTFGKASVQSVLELNTGSAIKLTTARYYTPKGRSIQAEGIVPDIKLKRARIEVLEQEDDVDPVKESNLSGHLDSQAAKKKKDKGAEKQDLASRDYQLFEALNLLKGLNLLQPKWN